MSLRVFAVLAGLLSAVPIAVAADPQSPDTFKDCDICPEMVAIPAGSFRLGSPPDEEAHSDDEGPVRTVTFARAFAAGRHEVTKREYAAFVAASGRRVTPGCYVDETGDWELREDRSWQDPGFAQSADEPVVCVSWDDADAYVAWLSAETGKDYRLLSEAEWEYATRAGSHEARYWGDDSALACDFANVHDRTSKAEISISWDPHDCDDGVARTAPVGRYGGFSTRWATSGNGRPIAGSTTKWVPRRTAVPAPAVPASAGSSEAAPGTTAPGLCAPRSAPASNPMCGFSTSGFASRESLNSDAFFRLTTETSAARPAPAG